MIGLSYEYLSTPCIWLYVFMPRAHFRVNLHSIVAWMAGNSLLETGEISEIQVTEMRYEPTTT